MIDFNDFILFLAKPYIGKQIKIRSITSFLKLVWVSILIMFAIDVFTGLTISAPLKYFNLLPSQNEILFNKYNILKISLLLPVIEELIFRLPLKISKVNLAIPLIIIIFLILYKLNIYVAITLSISLFGFLFIWIKKESDILSIGGGLFIKYFYVFFYLQALIFGFLHLTNYRVDFKFFYLFPLFVISYIFTGCFFGYIRVRYSHGIFLCIVTHIVVNSIYCFVLYK